MAKYIIKRFPISNSNHQIIDVDIENIIPENLKETHKILGSFNIIQGDQLLITVIIDIKDSNPWVVIN